jgi:hypothetical protein
MTIEQLFSLSSTMALLGWIILLASPFIPRAAQIASGIVIPGLLSILYAALILAFWSRAEGGFDSLAGVMQLFTFQELALAGWIHFLAFDMFLGAWEVRTAKKEGIAFYLIIPCLALTFMFGPIGFLLFMGLRAARYGAAKAAN